MNGALSVAEYMTLTSQKSANSSLDALTRDVQKIVLSNGLTVLTKEIHKAPVVSVQVWYRVGSRNETAGLHGISHQLEHLLFKGTQSRPIQFGHLFSALGSDSNAFTSYDMTAYFGTVGRGKLAALLELEADRMRHALINAEQLTSEQRVVISELQGYENSPGYRLGQAVMQRAFPHHPYGLPVGGTKSDVEQFTVDQVKDYYQRYYSPSNAVLVIAGDFETAEALAQVHTTFDPIPRGPGLQPPLPPALSPVVQTSKMGEDVNPLLLRQPGSAALLEAVYPLPNVHHPDVPAIDVMDAILSSGRNSRFYPALVDSGLTSHAGAYAAALMEPGWYNISIAATPGQDLAHIDTVVQQLIQDLQDHPVAPEELNRAKTQLKAGFILNNREIDHQASQLAYNFIVAGDPHYSDRYLAAVAQVTIAEVQRVAQTYLDPTHRTVGFFEPTQAEGNTRIGVSPATHIAENFMTGEPVDPKLVAQYLPQHPAAVVSQTQALPETDRLANGLQVLLLPDHSSPTVTLSGHLKAGNGFDLDRKAGVAGLTAANLLSGTTTKDDLTLARALEDCGASLEFNAYREGVTMEGYGLAADLPVLIETLADVLQRATFPEEKFQVSRQRALAGLQMELDDPGQLGRRLLQQRIYPATHPFYGFPTEDSLQVITRTDLVDFYQQLYRPDQTVLALEGDFELEQVRSLLQQQLGAWQNQGTAPTLQCPTVAAPPEIETVAAPLPGKTQVVTYLGCTGISRSDPRYYAALVFNQVLGGDTLASRLGSEIRDRQGLTYGIYSYFATSAEPGPFVIQMQTAPEDTQQAINRTLTLLKQFREQGITEAELDTAKRSILNSYPVELADPDILMQRLLMNQVYGLALDEIRQFPQHIEALTLVEVQAAIQSLIQPENLVIVSAGPVPPQNGSS